MDLSTKKANPYKVVNNQNSTKDVDLGTRVVEGMFSTFFYIDSDMDMLLPNCAKKSIQERGVGTTAGNKIKHLKDHDWSKVVARLDELDEREVEINGQMVKGIYHRSFYPNTTDSNDLLIKINEGLYDSRSIGFRYVNLRIARKDSALQEERELYEKYIQLALNPEVAEKEGYFFVVPEIKLYEGSDVAFGANQFTPLLATKTKGERNLAKDMAHEKLEAMYQLFKKGNLSDEGFQRLEMEMLQIKAFITNITTSEADNKDTLINEGRNNKSTSNNANDFYKGLLL